MSLAGYMNEVFAAYIPDYLCIFIPKAQNWFYNANIYLSLHAFREIARVLLGTTAARILAKQFIVPFLLGLKFNLITILPLFFAGIILLCKKAAFLGKIALFVTGLLGYGSAFSLGGLAGGFTGGLGGLGGFGGGVGGVPFFDGIRPVHDTVSVSGVSGVGGGYHPDLLGPGGYYKSEDVKRAENSVTAQPNKQDVLVDHFYNFEKKVLLQDRNSKLYEKELDAEGRGYRNFAWKTN